MATIDGTGGSKPTSYAYGAPSAVTHSRKPAIPHVTTGITPPEESGDETPSTAATQTSDVHKNTRQSLGDLLSSLFPGTTGTPPLNPWESSSSKFVHPVAKLDLVALPSTGGAQTQGRSTQAGTHPAELQRRLNALLASDEG